MKDSTKKILSLIFYSFIAFVIIIAYYVAIYHLPLNLIILGMIIAGIVATDFLVLNYKKSKYYILGYILSLFLIYIIGAYLYTFPFLAITISNPNCPGCGLPYLFMTNHFHILYLTNIFAYYDGIYIPYNISLYEPTYSMFPFQTKVPNLVNQTITLNILLKNQTFKARYKVVSESVVNLKQYLFKTNSCISDYYDIFYCPSSFSSSPVYLLNLTAEIPNPEIINMATFNWSNVTASNEYTKLIGWATSAEYDGITIT